MGSSKVKRGNAGQDWTNDPVPGEIVDRLYRAQRMLLRWVQILLASRPTGRFRWGGDAQGIENEEETEVLPSLQSPDRIESPHNKPAISVVRSQASWMGTSRDGLQRPAMLRDDSEAFSDMIGTSFVCNCIAQEGAEAQALAYLLFVSLRVHRWKALLIQASGLHSIGNDLGLPPLLPVGALYPGSKLSSWRMCQVIVPATLQETVTISPTNEPGFQVLLRDLTMTVVT